ncbi:formyl transferase [Haloarcula hispanica]|uniref:Formyl transferase n=1 Tax=Haloarcula hispanica TaxID=51589 RepID=A0A5J5LLS3_HALHI|nr:formyltransferase family protein [Haloarcula hispanica]KAA9410363.1 formyl transferase [Haloarcula hispanica]
MEVVFLGINDAGLRIYEWLCERESVSVRCLITTKEQLELIKEIQPEMVISAGFDHLVPAEILDVPQNGCINLHPSYLPHNRGKSPNVWSIVENTPAGVTLHFMSESFDEGPIIAQREVESSFADTGKDLHGRLEQEQFELFTDVWPDIEKGEIETQPQDDIEGKYHSIDDFKDLCEIDPDAKYTAKGFLDILRALTFPPFDNAQIQLDDEIYYIDVDIRTADEQRDEEDGMISSY